MSSIRLISGEVFDPANPCVDVLTPLVIARGLANEARFSGQTNERLSVAQHCVMLSLLIPKEHAWTALMHDASEAVLKDQPRPYKKHPAFRQYRDWEDQLMKLLAEKFGFAYPLPEEVVIADYRLGSTEALYFQGHPHEGVEPYLMSEVPNGFFKGWGSSYAEDRWLDRFKELKHTHKGKTCGTGTSH